MIREVLLENYLPEFMHDYPEPVAALKAENPEFNIIWKATDRILYNRFISTADEYGISRFEKMLGIHPTSEDNLESRRLRVSNRWLNTIPYTMKALIQKLTLLCRDDDFNLEHNFKYGYTLTINTNLEEYGKVGELEQIIDSMIPCNIVVESFNHIKVNEPEHVNFISGATTKSLMIEVTNYTEQIVLNDRVLNLYIQDNYIEVQEDKILNLHIPPDYPEMQKDITLELFINKFTETELEIGDDIIATPLENG